MALCCLSCMALRPASLRRPPHPMEPDARSRAHHPRLPLPLSPNAQVTISVQQTCAYLFPTSDRVTAYVAAYKKQYAAAHAIREDQVVVKDLG